MELEEVLHRDSPSEMDTASADSESKGPPAPKAASPAPTPEKDKSACASPDIRAPKPEQPPPHKSARADPVQPGWTLTQPTSGGLAGAPATFPDCLMALYIVLFLYLSQSLCLSLFLITVPVTFSPFVSACSCQCGRPCLLTT
ncbi:hypothetical protein P4O66_014546 [Electrophorus voltai]|uniref:Uncharacterized protein n=1 Tax=Electrophorus voltai TaxID=2609070 RepID=A0AAD9DT22_9TELE|nr:hypothetical protein P4O66_014546 [Electrophorus voltai]